MPVNKTVRLEMSNNMVAFCLCRRKFAYSTSDGQVFVRQFAVSPDDWVLVRTLDGHTAEVTQVSHGSIYWCANSMYCLSHDTATCKK